ncbi:MAG: CaiB/BaiF CoA transferase family protein [Acidimicrobiales bacterium]
MVRPLEGIRIVSLAMQYPGPFATSLLGDLGADVVVVEAPGGGDPARIAPSFFDSVNRGKRSVVVDLKSAKGRDVVLSLLEDADVLLDGYRPGTLDRLGLGEEVLTRTNAELAIVRISGYGQEGAYRLRSGHDLTYQAESGLSSMLGGPDGPPLAIPFAVGDLVASLFGVQAVLVGLLSRQRGLAHREFDVAIFDCLVSALTTHIGPSLRGESPYGFPTEPAYGLFRTKDGRYVALGIAHEDHFWKALCHALDLVVMATYSSTRRREDAEGVRNALAATIGSMNLEEVDARLGAVDVPYGVVRDIGAMAEHPLVVARRLISHGEGQAPAIRQPLVIDGEILEPDGSPMNYGAATSEVLLEAGWSRREIGALINEGVIGEGARTTHRSLVTRGEEERGRRGA